MLGSGIRDGGWEWKQPTTVASSANRKSKAGRGNKDEMSRGKSGRRRGRSRVSSSKGQLCTSAASKRLRGSDHQVRFAGASTRKATRGREQAKEWANMMRQRRRPGLGLSGSRRLVPCAAARADVVAGPRPSAAPPVGDPGGPATNGGGLVAARTRRAERGGRQERRRGSAGEGRRRSRAASKRAPEGQRKAGRKHRSPLEESTRPPVEANPQNSCNDYYHTRDGDSRRMELRAS